MNKLKQYNGSKLRLQLSIIVLVIFNSLNANSQSDPIFDWVNTIDEVLGGQLISEDLIIDHEQNIIAISHFSDSAIVKSLDTSITIVSQGGFDICITKHDIYGNLLWLDLISSSSHENVQQLSCDSNNNIYITGVATNVTDFDLGPGVSTLSPSGWLNYIAKYDSSGNFIWVKHFEPSFISELIINSNDELILAGNFSGFTDFDPGPLEFNLNTTALTSNTYICKLNSFGEFIYAKQFSSSFDLRSADADSDNNMYLCGSFNDTIDTDPSINVQNHIPLDDKDGLLVKVNSMGDLIWSRSFPGINNVELYDLAIWGDTSVAITGRFVNSVDSDPSIGINMHYSNGNSDIIISKLDSAGIFQWSKQLGGPEFDRGQSIDIGRDGKLYAAGEFSGAIDLDPSPAIFEVIPLGSTNVYVISLEDNGDFNWAKAFKGTSSNDGIGTKKVEVDSLNNIILGGLFHNSIDFDPNIGTTIKTANGVENGYKLKLSQCYSTNYISTESCFNYISPSGKYNWETSGNYIDTIINSTGCDSIIYFDLTIHNLYRVDTVTSCFSYTWINDSTYYQSTNSVSHTITNPLGCDSIIWLNLQVNQPDSVIDSHTTCDSLFWFDSTYYNSTDSPIHILPNQYGCDSVISLNLLINEVDVSVTQNDLTLLSNQSNAYYQWIDCSTQSAIPNATDQFFTPEYNIEYAVIVEYQNCIDTSECIQSTLGLNNQSPMSIKVYPNPTAESISILLPKKIDYLKINITNSLGLSVYNEEAFSTELIENIRLEETGFYSLEVIWNNSILRFPIIRI